LTLVGPADTLIGMANRALVTLTLIVALVGGARHAVAYSSSTWYEGAGGWAQARRQQRTHGVPILVYFRADWCAQCHALDETLEEPDVERRLRQVIKVRIDPDDGDEEQALFNEDFGGHSFPMLFLVSRNGARRQLAHGSTERLLKQLPAK
jgi:thiol:disulfide interchange protein